MIQLARRFGTYRKLLKEGGRKRQVRGDDFHIFWRTPDIYGFETSSSVRNVDDLEEGSAGGNTQVE